MSTSKNKQTKSNAKVKEVKVRSVDQLTIAKLVATRTGMTLADVQDVIELEQKLTMEYVKNGFKVIKKNYLTLIPRVIKGRVFNCPINGEEYKLETKQSVSIRVGEGFKSFISGTKKSMPERMCRFVDGDTNAADNENESAA